jgi:TetR/AcrR family transcriptional regulator of autoinduction and epiphytic fitness
MLPELGSREAVRTVLLTLTQQIVSLMMQPDYLALLRVIIAEMPRFPQLGRLFYEAVPEQTMLSLAHLLKKGQDEKTVAADIDIDAARRLLVGGMLTYAFLDGLFATDGEPRLPSAERLEALVDVFMRSIVSPLSTKCSQPDRQSNAAVETGSRAACYGTYPYVERAARTRHPS